MFLRPAVMMTDSKAGPFTMVHRARDDTFPTSVSSMAEWTVATGKGPKIVLLDERRR